MCLTGRQQQTVSAKRPFQVPACALPAVTLRHPGQGCAAPHSVLPTAVPPESHSWWHFPPRAGATSIILNMVKQSHLMAWKVPGIFLGFLGVWFSFPAVHIKKFNQPLRNWQTLFSGWSDPVRGVQVQTPWPRMPSCCLRRLPLVAKLRPVVFCVGGQVP